MKERIRFQAHLFQNNIKPEARKHKANSVSVDYSIPSEVYKEFEQQKFGKVSKCFTKLKTYVASSRNSVSHAWQVSEDNSEKGSRIGFDSLILKLSELEQDFNQILDNKMR